MRRAYALPLLALFRIVLPLLLRIIVYLLCLLILRVVQILALLWRFVLVAVLVILPTLLILGFAHRELLPDNRYSTIVKHCIKSL